MRTVSKAVKEKTSELLGILKQAKDWKMPIKTMATLLEVPFGEAKYILHRLRRELRANNSKYIIASDPGEGYYLADTSTPEGAKIATRESLKSGRRTFGHAQSSGYYHRRIDPKLVTDSKTAKLYAITSMYDEGRKILEGIREASTRLLSADSEAAKEVEEAEKESLDYLDEQYEKYNPQSEEDDDSEDDQ